MVHRFDPDDDPFGRRLVLIFGHTNEVTRRLRRVGAAREWKPTNAGVFFSREIRHSGGGKVRQYFVCVERGRTPRGTESTLHHEVYHYCMAALREIGVRTAARKDTATEEVFAYYQEWVYGRCLREIRRARA